jgi:XTP/dITP diphosphohydrolase
MTVDTLPTLVLATTNPGKVREYHHLLVTAGLPLRVVGLDEVGVVAPPETGTTFAENAILKARHAAERSGLPALADDSGLAVDGLGGAPGVYSARYAGENANDEANRQLLIAALGPLSEVERAGHFVCAIALAQPDGAVEVVEGTCDGLLLTEPRGDNGFGYDPLFFMPEQGRTMAELSLDEKSAVSHRALALACAMPLLRRAFGREEVGRAT